MKANFVKWHFVDLEVQNGYRSGQKSCIFRASSNSRKGLLEKTKETFRLPRSLPNQTNSVMLYKACEPAINVTPGALFSSFLPGVKLQSLRELRVVVVLFVVVVVVDVDMWCFYLPGHLTTTFAKQLL